MITRCHREKVGLSVVESVGVMMMNLKARRAAGNLSVHTDDVFASANANPPDGIPAA